MSNTIIIGDSNNSSTLTLGGTNTSQTSLKGTTVTVGGKLGIGTTPSAPLHIYEPIGPTGTTFSATAGSIILEHGNSGGSSSILFKSKTNSGSDYGYIYYVDDINGTTFGENGALCIGAENDTGGSAKDVLILNKNGGYVGIGKSYPSTALDVNGTITSGSITTGNISTSGNITAENIIVSGNISSSGNIATSGTIVVSGNIETYGNISAINFNLLGGDFVGNNASISLAGVITGTSVVTPSLDSSANDVGMNISTTQTTGVLNIGTGERSKTGVINIGTNTSNNANINIGGSNTSATSVLSKSESTVNINGKNLWSNTSGTTSIRSAGTVTIESTSAETVNIGGYTSTGIYNHVNIGNYGINTNARETNIRTQTTSIGTSGPATQVYLGHGGNNNTNVYNGIVSIQKLQVGNKTGDGSVIGTGTGTPFRCLITGTIEGGPDTGGRQTVILTNGPINAGFPTVIATINNVTTNNEQNMYVVNVNVTGNNSFTYRKRYISGGANTINDATNESISYIAIWY